MGIKNTVCKCCGGSLTVCGCANVNNVLHLTIPAAVATLLGTSTAQTLTFTASFGSPATGFMSPCFGFPGTPPNTNFLFDLVCSLSPAQFQLFGWIGNTTVSPPCAGSIGAFTSPSAVASPCGATFFWTVTIPGATQFSGTYTVSS